MYTYTQQIDQIKEDAIEVIKTACLRSAPYFHDRYVQLLKNPIEIEHTHYKYVSFNERANVIRLLKNSPNAGFNVSLDITKSIQGLCLVADQIKFLK